MRLSVCTIDLNYHDAKHIDYVLLLLDHVGFHITKVNREDGIIDCVWERRLVRSLKRANLFERLIESECFHGRLPPR